MDKKAESQHGRRFVPFTTRNNTLASPPTSRYAQLRRVSSYAPIATNPHAIENLAKARDFARNVADAGFGIAYSIG